MLWRKSLETGNVTVDRQHKEIFRLVQDVLDADAFSDRKEKIESSLNFLSAYAVRHFQTEEALMTESSYPGYDNHKAQHVNFVKAVSDFMEAYKTDGSSVGVSDTVSGFVVEWLNEHIMGSDREMAAFYKDWTSS